MAAYRKEQMLSMLDNLDADMEATKPIHWTVRKPCQMNRIISHCILVHILSLIWHNCICHLS